MAKVRTARKRQGEELSNELATYSVRFTEAERDVLGRAAALKGWSPTNLIRLAALDSAAAIINTSTQMTFKGLALKLAEQVAKPHFFLVRTTESGSADDTSYRRISASELANLGEWAKHEQILGIEEEVPQRSREEIAEINKAAKYGGVEFLRPFVEYNEGFAAPSRLDVSKLVITSNQE